MIPNKNRILFLFFLSLYTVHAQEKAYIYVDSLNSLELEEVIVTATRTERQFSSLPLPATLISQEEIKSVNSVRLTEILNEQTGLTTVTDFGGAEGIQLQGLDSEYTLILIDGTPLVGRSAGALDLNRLSIGNIKQIEIVKGASSCAYGNEALGGVINIITQAPQDGLNGNVNYRFSSFNSHDLNLQFNTQQKRLGLQTFLNRYSSNGYDLIKSDELSTVALFSNYTFETKLNYELNHKSVLKVSGRTYHQRQNNAISSTEAGKSFINEWNSALQLEHTHSPKHNSTLEFYTTQYKTREEIAEEESHFNQFFLRPELRTTYSPNSKHVFMGGIGVTYERVKRVDFVGTPSFSSPYIYMQYEAYPNTHFNIILGSRLDLHSQYSSQVSPKIAAYYAINQSISIKGSVGYGFKAPDFRQLYFNFSNSSVGYTLLGHNVIHDWLADSETNHDLADVLVPVSEFDHALRAESSVSYNLGVTLRPVESLNFSVNLFRNDISNLIDTRVIAQRTNGQNVFSYYNVGEVYTQGLEYNFTWQIYEHLSFSAGYQLLFAIDKAARREFKEGKVFAKQAVELPAFRLQSKQYFGLLNRSRHMANCKIFYTIPTFDLHTNLRGTYRSRYGLFDTNGNSYLDHFDKFVEGYMIWDLSLNKTFYKDYQLSLGIDNLFNFTNPQYISNVAGRIAYIKFILDIKT